MNSKFKNVNKIETVVSENNSANADLEKEIELRPPYIKISSPEGVKQIKSKVTEYYKIAMERYKAELDKTKRETLHNISKNVQTEKLNTNVRNKFTRTNLQSDLSGATMQNANQPLLEQQLSPLEKILKGLTEPTVDKKTFNKSSSISVSPNGIINLGWGCTALFKAQRSGVAFHHFWWLVTYEQQLEAYYLEATGIYRKINFPSEWIHYSLSALASQNNGKAKFFVSCETYDLAGNFIALERSQDIEIEFKSIPCLELHSLSPSNVELEGGDHGTYPEVTITLNVPAPVGGQPVNLTTNNSKIAWINSGYETVIIPAGQQSVKISGFLGTANVHFNRETLIVFSVNGKQSYVNLKIRK